jgi:hypothetical protein
MRYQNPINATTSSLPAITSNQMNTSHPSQTPIPVHQQQQQQHQIMNPNIPLQQQPIQNQQTPVLAFQLNQQQPINNLPAYNSVPQQANHYSNSIHPNIVTQPQIIQQVNTTPTNHIQQPQPQQRSL